MSLIGFVNLSDILLNQTVAPAAEIQAATPAAAIATNGATVATGDQFTPAAENAAQAAGLFTVTQFAVFSAAAEAILAQAPAQGGSPANPPPPAANATAQAAAQTAAQTTAETAVATNAAAAKQALAAATPPAPQAPANTAAAKAAAKAAAQAPLAATPHAPPASANTPAVKAAAVPAAPVNIEDKLQALNSALAALGVDKADLRKIDSIAVLIHDSSPTAFASFAQQIEGLPQQVAPQAPATAANANAANTSVANANAANTNAGGFHIQELLVRFAGAGIHGTAVGTNNATGETGGAGVAGGNAGPLPVATGTLQAQEVQLSLTDNNGHTLRVRALGEAANANRLAQTRTAKA